MDLPVICPFDRQPLASGASGWTCASCKRFYPVREGVICTLEHVDAFYEGAYENQINYLPGGEAPWRAWPLWLINSGYVWTVREAVKPGAAVVELGCAGGVRYFGKRYRMIGCDLSLASLSKMDFYEHRVQADAARCIPLPDSSVDAVVSSYFWEHIPPTVKPSILRECRRVLTPGGRLVFLYDVETQNPLIRRYRKRQPALYEELFVTNDGHLGYQSPEENLELFENAGFRVIRHQGMEKTFVQSPAAYEKLRKFGRADHHLFAWAARLGRQPFFYPYTAVVRLVDTLVGPLLPTSWARVALAVCEKKL
jgi:SAM-dependent methyltransferase